MPIVGSGQVSLSAIATEFGGDGVQVAIEIGTHVRCADRSELRAAALHGDGILERSRGHKRRTGRRVGELAQQAEPSHAAVGRTIGSVRTCADRKPLT